MAQFYALPPLWSTMLRGERIYLADDAALAAFRAEHPDHRAHVSRMKGLGEMDADQLADTTMNPRHRTLRRITVDEAGAADAVFEKLMGNDVAPRKEFIIEGAYALDAERIDA